MNSKCCDTCIKFYKQQNNDSNRIFSFSPDISSEETIPFIPCECKNDTIVNTIDTKNKTDEITHINDKKINYYSKSDTSKLKVFISERNNNSKMNSNIDHNINYLSSTEKENRPEPHTSDEDENLTEEEPGGINKLFRCERNRYQLVWNQTCSQQRFVKERGKREIRTKNTPCSFCKTTETCVWRRINSNIVCNACGLYYRIHGTKRPQNIIKNRKKRITKNLKH